MTRSHRSTPLSFRRRLAQMHRLAASTWRLGPGPAARRREQHGVCRSANGIAHPAPPSVTPESFRALVSAEGMKRAAALRSPRDDH